MSNLILSREYTSHIHEDAGVAVRATIEPLRVYDVEPVTTKCGDLVLSSHGVAATYPGPNGGTTRTIHGTPEEARGWIIAQYAAAYPERIGGGPRLDIVTLPLRTLF